MRQHQNIAHVFHLQGKLRTGKLVDRKYRCGILGPPGVDGVAHGAAAPRLPMYLLQLHCDERVSVVRAPTTAGSKKVAAL